MNGYLVGILWLLGLLTSYSVWAQRHETLEHWDAELGLITEHRVLEGGMRQGLQQWLLNGIRMRSQYYDMDAPVGPGYEYWENGNSKARFTRNPQGQLTGAYSRFYPNRQLIDVVYYHEGEMVPSTIRTYYANGRLAAVRCYRTACVPAAGYDRAQALANWPEMGTQVPSHWIPDSTWLLYNYRGRLLRERQFTCGQTVLDKVYSTDPDTIVKGTNSFLPFFRTKSIIVTQDTAGDPLILKKFGKYGEVFGHDDWVSWRIQANYRDAESYYVSKARKTSALKRYYSNGTAAYVQLYQPGNLLRNVLTYYNHGKLKETWQEDLSGNRVGEYIRYWPNGSIQTTGFYAQDSTATPTEITRKGLQGELFAHKTYPSNPHGDWKTYDYNQKLTDIRSYLWGVLQNKED